MVGIISNQAAMIAQRNLESANSSSEASIGRLSSGNRITRASDDVAGLAVGTVLKTDVSTLRKALENTNQANALLAVVDGALSTIGDMLQRQKALAVQANSGTLTETARNFLNEEFRNLKTEIDRIVDSTNFNGIQLLDGSIFDKADATTDTADDNSISVGSIEFTAAADLAAGESVIVNGTTFTATATTTASTDFLRAGTLTTDLDALVSAIQAQTSPELAEATYSRSGNSLVVQSVVKSGVAAQFTLDANDTDGTVNGATGVNEGVLLGATAGGVAKANTSFNGTVGDTIIDTTTSAKGTATGLLDLSADADNSAGDEIFINGSTFTIVASVTDATTQILEGSTTAITVANVASFLNNSNLANIGLATYEVSSSNAEQIVITYNTDSADAAGFDFANNTNKAAGTVTALSGGGDGGINLAGLSNNADFTGTISGFNATYLSTDSVQIDITVGDYTYSTTTNVDTTPTAATTIRLNADDVKGGHFEIRLAANQGSSVTNQSEADNFAARLDAAFENLTFQQVRDIESYSATGLVLTGSTTTGDLSGTKFTLDKNDFSDVKIESVLVEAPLTGQTTGANIEIVIDGETYKTASGLSQDIAIGAKVALTSTTNPNNVLTFFNGDTAVNIQTDAQASAFQSALEDAFGLKQANGLSFQVGTGSVDNIAVAVQSSNTSSIYKNNDGDFVDIEIGGADSSNAIIASDVLDNAINTVTTIRATVGALQSRFGFAAVNLNSSIENIDAARGSFLDTDIAGTSTEFATSSVRLSASISVLAQANQLPQNLLKLIG